MDRIHEAPVPWFDKNHELVDKAQEFSSMQTNDSKSIGNDVPAEVRMLSSESGSPVQEWVSKQSTGGHLNIPTENDTSMESLEDIQIFPQESIFSGRSCSQSLLNLKTQAHYHKASHNSSPPANYSCRSKDQDEGHLGLIMQKDGDYVSTSVSGLSLMTASPTISCAGYDDKNIEIHDRDCGSPHILHQFQSCSAPRGGPDWALESDISSANLEFDQNFGSGFCSRKSYIDANQGFSKFELEGQEERIFQEITPSLTSSPFEKGLPSFLPFTYNECNKVPLFNSCPSNQDKCCSTNTLYEIEELQHDFQSEGNSLWAKTPGSNSIDNDIDASLRSPNPYAFPKEEKRKMTWFEFKDCWSGDTHSFRRTTFIRTHHHMQNHLVLWDYWAR